MNITNFIPYIRKTVILREEAGHRKGHKGQSQ